MDGQRTLRQRLAGVHKALKKKVSVTVKGEQAATAGRIRKRQQEAAARGVLGDITNQDALIKPGPTKKRSKKEATDVTAAKAGPAQSNVPASAVDLGSSSQRLPETSSGSESKSAPSSVAASSGSQQTESRDDRQLPRDQVMDGLSNETSCASTSSLGTSDSSTAGSATSSETLSVASSVGSDASAADDVWVDIDKECSNDPSQSPEYAADIFNYYKTRELKYPFDHYMPRQHFLTAAMRAILVDWLVEVQENFELNHETLYTAVKLVDLYLARSPKSVPRESLQLVGAAAMFIGCKFDERIPPLVDDFLYICDDAYNRQDFVAMEKEILRAVDFDVGIPISYTFLRRYAKCARVGMDTLTLARYILELCLMHYELSTTQRDSLLAAAALWLAVRMKKLPATWDGTMRHYTGYNLTQVLPVAAALNKMLRENAAAPAASAVRGGSPVAAGAPASLHTIRTKYSHEVFFHSAAVPLVDDCELTPRESENVVASAANNA